MSSRVSTRASAKYLGHPTALYRGEDGILWRVPLQRDRDEVDLEMLGHVLVGTSAEQPPRTRGEILRYLDGLRDRLTDSLPSW